MVMVNFRVTVSLMDWVRVMVSVQDSARHSCNKYEMDADLISQITQISW